MKLAMLTPNLPPRRCGVGDNACLLASELQFRGHGVALLASAGNGGGLRSETRVVPVPGSPWNPRRAAQVAWTVAGLQVEVLHYHYAPHLYGRRGITLGASLLPWLVRRHGVPVVTTFHELAMPWAPAPGRAAVAALQRAQLALLVMGSDQAIATTRHRMWKLRRWFPVRAERIHLVPVGSNISAGPESDRDAIRRELGLESKLVLGFFGMPHPSKNMPLLARCVEGLAAAGVDVLLLCIGLEPGELSQWLEGCGPAARVTLERALCTGWVPPERASRLLAAVDIFPQPMVDGLSTLRTTTIAALARGLAVVGTRGRETDADLLGPAVCLVPVGDETGFIEAVANLARSPAHRAELGAAARALYARCLSWPRLAEATLDVYLAAAAAAGRSP